MLALKAFSACGYPQLCRMASNPKWPIYSDQIVQSIQFEYCITAFFCLNEKMAYIASTQINCIFFVGSFLFSVPNCALMMAVSAFSQGQLSRTVPVGSSDSHGRSGARSGGSSSVRSAPPRPRPADDRSDCRSDRSSLSDGARHSPELATADANTGKRHAAASPIGAECVACVVGVLGAPLEKLY